MSRNILWIIILLAPSGETIETFSVEMVPSEAVD
jgi:hypothetical protein